MVEFWTETILVLELLTKRLYYISDISNYKKDLIEIYKILQSIRSYMDLWEYFGLNMRSPLKFRIHYKILNGNRIDRRSFLHMPIFISTHHIIEYRIHILSQKILIVIFQIERIFFWWSFLNLMLFDLKIHF